MFKSDGMLRSPIFSVITVTYNAVNTLEKTILSVINQDNSLFEYLIIDGGSTDGTIDCIKKYEDKIHYWVSEKDDGIYDAMNKGISNAKGKWILFLGADDRLIPNVLKIVNQGLSDSFDLIYGNVIFNNGERYYSDFKIKTLLNNTIHHQGAFYNKRLFEKFRYDTTIKIMADYELNLFIYLARKRRKKINIDIAECDVLGASSEIDRSLNELILIQSKYYNTFMQILSSSLIRIKYFIHYKL